MTARGPIKSQLNPWHKQVQHFMSQGYVPIAAPDGNVTFQKGDKYYSWTHDKPGAGLEELLPEHAIADLEYAGPWNEPELQKAPQPTARDLIKLSAAEYADLNKSAGLFLRDRDTPLSMEIPTGKNNKLFQLAEKYREPRLLAKPFYHNDERALVEAMSTMAMIDPTLLERGSGSKPFTQHDAASFGLNLKFLYPDRFRLPPDGERALGNNPAAATSRRETLNFIKKISAARDLIKLAAVNYASRSYKTAGLFDFLKRKPEQPPVPVRDMTPDEIAVTAKIFDEMCKRRHREMFGSMPTGYRQAQKKAKPAGAAVNAPIADKIAAFIAAEHIAPLAGAGVGAGIGALTSKKHRLRNALIGAGAGGLTGGIAERNLAGLGLGMKYKLQDTFMPDSEQSSFWSPVTARDKARGEEVFGLISRNAMKNPGGALTDAFNSKSLHPGLDLFFPNKSAGLFDFLKKTPKPADDWAPPAGPIYADFDAKGDYEGFEAADNAHMNQMKKYLKGRGYSDIKEQTYEPGGTPWSMQGPDKQYYELQLGDGYAPAEKPVSLKELYGVDKPEEYYRQGPGIEAEPNWAQLNAQTPSKLRTEAAVRKYLQNWSKKHKNPSFIDDSWEDLEEDLPLRWGPDAFHPSYLTDDLHADIGNRLRDPKQFEGAMADLLPKLNLKKRTKSAGQLYKAALGNHASAQRANEEKQALMIPAWGGRDFSAAPRGVGVGLNAGWSHLAGILPVPHAGIDIGGPHHGLQLSGPLPGIGLRAGLFSRPPGLSSTTSYPRSLWATLADNSSDPDELEERRYQEGLKRFKNLREDEIAGGLEYMHPDMAEKLRGSVAKQLFTESRRPAKKPAAKAEKHEHETAKAAGDGLSMAPVYGALLGAAGGVKTAGQLYKTARPLGLDSYSSVAGPDQIQHAIQQYGQLKALVRPDDSMLKSRELSRAGFQKALRQIVNKSQGQEHYNLSSIAPDPKMRAGIAAGLGLLGTAGLGYAGGMSGVGAGLAGTGIGAAATYLHASQQRKNMLNTAKLMKEYGLLKPKLLQSAYPLLADEYKFAAAPITATGTTNLLSPPPTLTPAPAPSPSIMNTGSSPPRQGPAPSMAPPAVTPTVPQPAVAAGATGPVNNALSQHMPGTYSQLPDGSYVSRADITDKAPAGGYSVVPAGHGVKTTNNPPVSVPAPATNATPAPATTPAPVATHEATTDKLKNAAPDDKANAVANAASATASTITADPANKEKLVEAQTPEGQQRIAAQAGQDFVAKAKAENPADSNTPDFFGKVQGMWDGMGPAGQMAFAFGVPTALISLLGGDGLTSLLGGLGIGVAGMGAGAMGMLGNQTQANVGKVMGDVGNFFGVIPDSARDAANFQPGSASEQKAIADIQQHLASNNPEAAKKIIADNVGQFKQLEGLYNTKPALAYSYLMGMKNGPKTPQEAEVLYKQLQQRTTEAQNPDFIWNQANTRGGTEFDNTLGATGKWLAEKAMGPEGFQTFRGKAIRQGLARKAPGLVPMYPDRFKEGSVARQIVVKRQALKAAMTSPYNPAAR